MTHMKDTYYFSHDSNARSDPKILALRSVYGIEGYGRFWILIEMLREQSDFRLKLNSSYVRKAIAKELECDEDDAMQFIRDCIEEFELFETDGEYFWSNSLLRRMEIKKEKSEKARQAAQARWEKKKQEQGEEYANAMQVKCGRSADAVQVKESKVKESKEKINKSTSSTSTGTETVTVPRGESYGKNSAAAAIPLSSPESKVIKAYSNNISVLPSPFEVEKITSYLDQLEADLIVYAIEEAVRQNVRRLAYVEKILQRFISKGIKTREQAEAFKKQRKGRESPSTPPEKEYLAPYHRLYVPPEREKKSPESVKLLKVWEGNSSEERAPP